MYKTLYFRWINQKKKEKDIIELLVDGAMNQITHRHWNEGTELGLLLINYYNQKHVKESPQSLGKEPYSTNSRDTKIQSY